MVAFRQALYEKTASAPDTKVLFDVSLRQVAEITGTYKDTVKRHRDSGKLDWFLRHTPRNKYARDRVSGEAHRMAHEYNFHMLAPPTPGDQDTLQEWLRENGIENDPVATLQMACKQNPKTLLPYPARRPTALQKSRKPNSDNQSFLAAILAVCPADTDTERRSQVIEKAELLTEHLVNGFGQVILTHYFLKHWLPLIGPTPACAVTICRSRGYHNNSSGELRDHFRLAGGYPALAKLLGKNVPTSLQFLPRVTVVGHRPGARRKNPNEMSVLNAQRAAHRARIRELTANFIYRVTYRQTNDLRVFVKMTEFLTPDHQSDYENALCIVSAFYNKFGPNYHSSDVDQFMELLDQMGVFKPDNSIDIHGSNIDNHENSNIDNYGRCIIVSVKSFDKTE